MTAESSSDLSPKAASARSWIRSLLLWLFVATAIALAVFPQIDLAVSALASNGPAGFPFGGYPAVQLLHEAWTWMSRAIALALALFMLVRLAIRSSARLRQLRAAGFLLLLMLLGPGLLVNVLKDNWGRARPAQITEFGGTAHFTPFLVPAKECARNCSFPSGHAAIGFWFMGPAFTDRRRRTLWFGLGILCGLGIGCVRIAQGGHFLSDVLFSGWIVYGTALVLSRMLLERPGAMARSA
jgi:lipid A 4'-phosphatase